jgi:hypothetical protein
MSSTTLPTIEGFRAMMRSVYNPPDELVVCNLCPTSSTAAAQSSNPQSFYSWAHLPTSIKLDILDLVLVGNRNWAVAAEMHALHSMHSDLEPLLSTSREMRDLAYRSYYKYGIILKPVYNWACFRVVNIPCDEAARHIRRIELHLDIPNVLRSGKIWRHRTEKLLHLLRPEDADSSSARKSA